MDFEKAPYKTLLYYLDQDFSNAIPQRSGNYFWVYYPDISQKEKLQEVIPILKEYTKVDLCISEVLHREKYSVEVRELFYNHKNQGNLFGLSKAKECTLVDYLESSQNNLNYFKSFFKSLCFSRPFYIGKAKNLRGRLKEHFSGCSEVLSEIENRGIPKNHIWIGYEIIDTAISEDVLNIFEEVLQRKLKPGLTQRFG